MKQVTFDDVVDYLGSDNTLEDTIGILLDIANGNYTASELNSDVNDYKEHQ